MSETSVRPTSFGSASSIKQRLVLLCGLAVAVLVSFGIYTIYSFNSMAKSLKFVTTTGEAMRNHLEGDMMHDAIRADVYVALGGYGTKQESLQDLDEHIAWFEESVKKNGALSLTPAIRQELQLSGQKLAGYASEARGIVTQAYTDRARANAALPKFTAAFESLEKQNEALSDKIAAEAQAAERDASAEVARAQWLVTVLMVVFAVCLLGAGWRIALSITEPIREIVEFLRTLAGGELRQRAKEEGCQEVREMARALNAAVASMESAVSVIVSASKQIASNSEELGEQSGNISNASQSTASGATELAAACGNVSVTLQSVSASGSEMSSAIREISTQAGHAAMMARQASDAAASANSLFGVLDRTNQEISRVVDVISAIANQTNLLALNATIEAARAGESGRGFAVVANEVKKLASQTAKATEDITSRIAGMRDQSERSVQALRAITDLVDQMAGASSTIAAAVEEQTAATNEVEMQILGANRSTQEIADSVNSFAQSAEVTSESARSSFHAAQELKRIAKELELSVEHFRIA